MNKNSKIIKIPIFGIGIILAIFVVLIVFQRSFLYLRGGYPGTPESAGLKEMQEVFFETDDGVSLFSWYAEPKKNLKTGEINPTIIYFHGNRSHVGFYIHKVKELANKGFGVFMLEYRGYGGNAGRPSEVGLISDAKGALVFLQKKGINLDNIIFYGEALGAGVAVALAAEHHPKGLILEAPFTSRLDVVLSYWPHLPVELILFDKFDSMGVIDKINTPLLIVHGKKDKKFPYQMSEKLLEKALEPKRVHLIEEAGHQDNHKYGLLKIICDWIDNLPKKIETGGVVG